MHSDVKSLHYNDHFLTLVKYNDNDNLIISTKTGTNIEGVGFGDLDWWVNLSNNIMGCDWSAYQGKNVSLRGIKPVFLCIVERHLLRQLYHQCWIMVTFSTCMLQMWLNPLDADYHSVLDLLQVRNRILIIVSLMLRLCGPFSQ